MWAVSSFQVCRQIPLSVFQFVCFLHVLTQRNLIMFPISVHGEREQMRGTTLSGVKSCLWRDQLQSCEA